MLFVAIEYIKKPSSPVYSFVPAQSASFKKVAWSAILACTKKQHDLNTELLSVIIEAAFDYEAFPRHPRSYSSIFLYNISN